MEKNLKAAIEQLQATAAALTPELLDAICRNAEQSRTRFEKALIRFNEAREARQRRARSGAAQSSLRLQELDKRKADLTDAIGNAYSEQQIEKAHELEAELEELAREEYGVKEAATHVQAVKVRGDLGLFAELKDAYDKKRAEEAAVNEDLEQLRKELRTLEGLISSYSLRAKDLTRAYTLADNPADEQMVEAAESIIGPLDLSGGMEGFGEGAAAEKRAKIAVVCRSSQNKEPAGKLKNTPAFRKWIELLKQLPKGGAKHE